MDGYVDLQFDSAGRFLTYLRSLAYTRALYCSIRPFVSVKMIAALEADDYHAVQRILASASDSTPWLSDKVRDSRAFRQDVCQIFFSAGVRGNTSILSLLAGATPSFAEREGWPTLLGAIHARNWDAVRHLAFHLGAPLGGVRVASAANGARAKCGPPYDSAGLVAYFRGGAAGPEAASAGKRAVDAGSHGLAAADSGGGWLPAQAAATRHPLLELATAQRWDLLAEVADFSSSACAAMLSLRNEMPMHGLPLLIQAASTGRVALVKAIAEQRGEVPWAPEAAAAAAAGGHKDVLKVLLLGGSSPKGGKDAVRDEAARRASSLLISMFQLTALRRADALGLPLQGWELRGDWSYGGMDGRDRSPRLPLYPDTTGVALVTQAPLRVLQVEQQVRSASAGDSHGYAATVAGAVGADTDAAARGEPARAADSLAASSAAGSAVVSSGAAPHDAALPLPWQRETSLLHRTLRFLTDDCKGSVTGAAVIAALHADCEAGVRYLVPRLPSMAALMYVLPESHGAAGHGGAAKTPRADAGADADADAVVAVADGPSDSALLGHGTSAKGRGKRAAAAAKKGHAAKGSAPKVEPPAAFASGGYLDAAGAGATRAALVHISSPSLPLPLPSLLHVRLPARLELTIDALAKAALRFECTDVLGCLQEMGVPFGFDGVLMAHTPSRSFLAAGAVAAAGGGAAADGATDVPFDLSLPLPLPPLFLLYPHSPAALPEFGSAASAGWAAGGWASDCRWRFLRALEALGCRIDAEAALLYDDGQDGGPGDPSGEAIEALRCRIGHGRLAVLLPRPVRTAGALARAGDDARVGRMNLLAHELAAARQRARLEPAASAVAATGEASAEPLSHPDGHIAVAPAWHTVAGMLAAGLRLFPRGCSAQQVRASAGLRADPHSCAAVTAGLALAAWRRRRTAIASYCRVRSLDYDSEEECDHDGARRTEEPEGEAPPHGSAVADAGGKLKIKSRRRKGKVAASDAEGASTASRASRIPNTGRTCAGRTTRFDDGDSVASD